MNFSDRSPIFRNFLVIPLALGLPLVSVVSHSSAAISSYAMTKQAQSDNQANNQSNNQIIALALINQLIQGNFTEATANFSPEMRRGVTVEQLQQVWAALTQELGDFQQIKDITRQTLEGQEVFIIVCQFAKDSLRLQIAVNGDRQVAGLQILPNQISQVFTPPNYADPDKFQEQEVRVGSGANSLPGTLTMPKGEGTFPVVVLVHGSGPNDRDETLGGNKPFRDLAWGLASLGIAVLRYDKRTLVYPQEFQGNFTIQEEVVDDAIAAVALLRQTPQINPQKIYVLGHSLGGMVIPRIGARDPQIAGLITLAAPTRPFEDLFMEQTIYLTELDGSFTEAERKLLDGVRQQVEIIRNTAWDNLPAGTILLGTPISYWQDLRGYNPAIAAQGLSQRMLILQGERDYQVTMQDFQGWQAALRDRSNATLKSYPQLNHLFIPGTGVPSPAEYQVPSHVAETVIKDIASWINNPAP
jgi:uncharacterized protein